MPQMDYWAAICPDYRDLTRRYAAARLQGEQVPTRYEFSFMTKGGEEKWIDCSPIVISYNGQPAILMTLIDITDRKASEKALKESKAEAELYLDLMGHDINNMNMIAMGNIEFALGRLQSKGDIEDADRLLLEKSIETLQGASRLIGNVRKLRKERLGEYKTKIVDLESVLREAVADYSGVPGKGRDHRPFLCAAVSGAGERAAERRVPQPHRQCHQALERAADDRCRRNPHIVWTVSTIIW